MLRQLALLCLFACSLSQIEGTSLRLCRELNYEYRVDPQVAADLRVASGDAQRLDHQLVLLATQLSEVPGTSQQCMFSWKQLVCSNVFRSPDGLGGTAPPCRSLCEAAERDCFGERYAECTDGDGSATERCTNYKLRSASTLQQCIASQQNHPSVPQLPDPRPPAQGGGGGGFRPRNGAADRLQLSAVAAFAVFVLNCR